MTLEQLRIFTAVAERQHITRAAAALHLTQSAVSGAIAALEARHGVRLFDRIGRGIALNAAGAAFLPEARGVLARAAAAEAALADLGGLARGRLTIHASRTIAAAWLPRRLVRFHAAHPGIVLDVAVGNTAEVARAVTDGAGELGFVEGATADPALERSRVGEDRLVVLVPRGHPWSDGAALSPAALQAGAWVLREPGSGTRSSLEAALAAAGVDLARLNVTMTLPGNQSVLAAVEAGGGATALGESVAAEALAAGRLIKAGFELPARTYWLLRHRDRYRSRAGEAFIEMEGKARGSAPQSSHLGPRWWSHPQTRMD